MTTKFLIRDDGAVIVEANAHTLKLPNFYPYEYPKPVIDDPVSAGPVVSKTPKNAEELVVEEKSVDYSPDDAEFDVEWASKSACIEYAKQNFGVDISKEKNLAKLRAKVKELLNGNSSFNDNQPSSN